MKRVKKHILQAHYFKSRFLNRIYEIELNFKKAEKFPEGIKQQAFDSLEIELRQVEERYNFEAYMSINLEKYIILSQDSEASEAKVKQLASA